MRIGIDLGGTKIEGVVISDSGVIEDRQRIETPRGSYSRILATIVDLVTRLEKSCGEPCSVGIGTPGYVSPQTGRLSRGGNTVELEGQALATDLQKLLGREIRIANDANCFALSEAVDGAGQGANIVLGFIIGTGTGSGIVINGNLLTGKNNIAGELGHNALPWMTEQELPESHCHCGNSGCVEQFLSGPGLAMTYKRISGKSLDTKSIVAHASENDRIAIKCLDLYYDQMARALSQVINFLDPDVIVLGGGMSNVSAIYEEVPKRWLKYCYLDEVETKLVPAKHGDSSGVRGAAWLW